LRGRSGRQGDPGESRFFISLEDDLMRLFGSERIMGVVNALGLEDDMPIENKMLSGQIENAQRRVEGRNFNIRKHVIQFDDVMNTQRELIYSQRRSVLEGADLSEPITKMREAVVEALAAQYTGESDLPDSWDLDGLIEKTQEVFGESAQLEINRNRKEIEELRSRLAQKNEKLDQAKARILNDANEQARNILQEAKDYADQTIKNFNKWNAEGGLSKDMENERNALRNKLSETESKLVIKNKSNTKKIKKINEIKLGDAVNVLSLGLKGTVSSLPNAKGDLFVQMGILRSQVNISDLELIDEPVITGPNLNRTGSGKIKMSKTISISTDINLIGKTVDEALPLLDKYLDDAYLSHLPKVTIIHGRGTGALKNAVHSHLKKTKYVKSFRIGEFGEGDHGVTIVEFV
jgi:dsDNA-specific endonuclease/ATPase MutS2